MGMKPASLGKCALRVDRGQQIESFKFIYGRSKQDQGFLLRQILPEMAF